MKEFKRTKPQDQLDQEESIFLYTDDGQASSVPKDPDNRDYALFLQMQSEGYEAWWHDEEIDWEQSWEKEKNGLTKELEEMAEPPKPIKQSRKKKIAKSEEENA